MLPSLPQYVIALLKILLFRQCYRVCLSTWLPCWRFYWPLPPLARYLNKSTFNKNSLAKPSVTLTSVVNPHPDPKQSEKSDPNPDPYKIISIHYLYTGPYGSVTFRPSECGSRKIFLPKCLRIVNILPVLIEACWVYFLVLFNPDLGS